MIRVKSGTLDSRHSMIIACRVCSRYPIKSLRFGRWPQVRFIADGNIPFALWVGSTSLTGAYPVNATTKISSVYLDRARSIAGEHEKLSRQLAKGYDAKIARKLGELNTTTLALRNWELVSKVGHGREYAMSES